MSTISTNLNAARSLELSEPSRIDLGRGASLLFLVIVVLLINNAFDSPITESWKRSLLAQYDNPLAAVSSLRQGTFARQLAIFSLGMFGVAGLLWPGGRKINVGNVLGILCFSYLAWCAATTLWSDDSALSIRRLFALWCEILAGAAIAKHCSPRQLVWIVFACTLSWLALGISAEVSLGTFRPWENSYRFAGILHPNEMGINCAILFLSAYYLISTGREMRYLLYPCAAVALMFVFLSGSRSAVGAFVVALTLQWVIIAFRSRLFVLAVAIALISGCTAVAMGLGWFGLSADLISMGRESNNSDEASTLTGRVPLWDELMNDYVSARPLTGHGFASFWTETRITEISKSQTWPVASSHSAYIDLMLNVGVIGMLLCLGAMVVALVKAARLEAKNPGLGYGFVAQIIVFALAAGWFETTIGVTWFLSFFGICGVCFLLFKDAPQPEAAPAIEKPLRPRPPRRLRSQVTA